jgi:hypothetical protein
MIRDDILMCDVCDNAIGEIVGDTLVRFMPSVVLSITCSNKAGFETRVLCESCNIEREAQLDKRKFIMPD